MFYQGKRTWKINYRSEFKTSIITVEKCWSSRNSKSPSAKPLAFSQSIRLHAHHQQKYDQHHDHHDQHHYQHPHHPHKSISTNNHFRSLEKITKITSLSKPHWPSYPPRRRNLALKHGWDGKKTACQWNAISNILSNNSMSLTNL